MPVSIFLCLYVLGPRKGCASRGGGGEVDGIEASRRVSVSCCRRRVGVSVGAGGGRGNCLPSPPL